MTDLERAIEQWKRPFQGSVIYDRSAIEELEDHLRMRVGRAVAEGFDLEAAWETAIQLVGTEPDLRGEYQQVWMERPRVIRWWLAIASEGQASGKPGLYRALRLISLGAGAFGILFALNILLDPRLPPLAFDPDQYLHLQRGRLLNYVMALTAFFNLIPFGAWTATGDRLRGSFATGAGLLGVHTVTLGLVALVTDSFFFGDAIEPFFWGGLVLIGPALWVLQLRWQEVGSSVLPVTAN